MKILIDTDLLLEKDVSIDEYVIAILINAGSDGFFQLARYNKKYPVNEEIITSTYAKGLVNYVDYIKEDTPKTIFSLAPSAEFSEIIEPEHLSSWISEWIELWPRQIKSGGYRVKSSLIDVTSKMKRFRARYPYSKDVIMESTQNYIKEFEIKGFAYMKLAKYFILKGDESVLADECEAVLEDSYSPIINAEHYGEQEL